MSIFKIDGVPSAAASQPVRPVSPPSTADSKTAPVAPPSTADSKSTAHPTLVALQQEAQQEAAAGIQDGDEFPFGNLNKLA